MNTAKGFFVAIDGPSGVGKSTVTAELAQRLNIQARHGKEVVRGNRVSHAVSGTATVESVEPSSRVLRTIIRVVEVEVVP